MGTAHQPRTTARLLITLAVTLSLLAAQLVGFGLQPAHASGEGWFLFEDDTGHQEFVEYDFDEPGGNVTIPGYSWDDSQGGDFHVSCSQTLLGTTATVTSADTGFPDGTTVTIVDFFNVFTQPATPQECGPGDFVDLDLDKSLAPGAPDTVGVGESTTFVLTATNHEDPVEHVRIEDDVPPMFDFEVVSTDPTADCTVSGQHVDCGPIDLDTGESFTVTIEVTVSAEKLGDLGEDGCGVVTNDGELFLFSALIDEDSADVTVECPDPEPEVEITKLVDGETSITVGPGDSFTYSIEVSETSGDVDAHDVVVTDELDLLDGDLTVTGTDPGEPDCTIEDDELTCDVGTLEAGSSETITVDIDVADVDSCGTVTNVASVAWDGGDATSGQTTVTIEGCDPDLDLEKAATEGTVTFGDGFDYVLTVSNEGDAAATAENVTVTDTIPDAFEIDEAGITTDPTLDPPLGCEVNGQDVTCDVGDLAPGDSVEITVPVTVAAFTGDLADACGVFPNTATADADNHDAVTSDEVEVEVVGCEADVSFEKGLADGSPATISIDGGSTTYELTATNDADATATAEGVVIHDTLPAVYDIGTIDPEADCDVDHDANTVTCGPVDLAPGASFTVTIDVTANPDNIEIGDIGDAADKCGVVTNAGELYLGVDNGIDGATPAATDDVDVTIEDCEAVLALSKTAAAAEIDLAGTGAFTVVVTNDDDATANAQGVVVTDDLPVPLSVPEGDEVTWAIEGGDDGTCLVTAQSGPDGTNRNSQITCTITELAAGGQLTITIPVEVVAGDLAAPDLCIEVTNTATVLAANAQGEPSDTATIQIDGCDPAIDIVKTADPTLVEYDLTAGDDVDVTYTYDVTNTGNVRLFDLTLVDDYDLERGGAPVSVDLDTEIAAALTDQLGRDYLDPDETVTVTAVFTLTLDDVLALLDESEAEDAATLDNVATTTGSSEPEGDPDVQADDDAQVDIETVEVLDRVLGLELDKEALVAEDEDGNKTVTVSEGEPVTVTYRYTITNTGNVDLFDLTLDDDVIGDLTDDLAAVLEGLTLPAGETVTVDVDYTLSDDEVAAGEVANVAVATGVDEFDVEVADDDDEVVFVIEVLDVVEVVEEEEAPATLPRTGADTTWLSGLGLLLAALGLATLLFTPRRRPIEWRIR